MYRHEEELNDALRQMAKALPVVELDGGSFVEVRVQGCTVRQVTVAPAW